MNAILQALNTINYWENKPNFHIGFIRSSYLNVLENALGNKLIKVIVGQRRAGKSYIIRQLIELLINKKKINPKNIFYLNKELFEYEPIKTASNLSELIKLYETKYKPKGKVYIIIDEVQNIPAWEKWVLKEYELSDNQIYVTGSNSNLLGREFSSSLSGRYLAIEIYPLSFKEYLNFFGMSMASKAEFLNYKLKIKQLFNQYVKYGGFPKVALTNDEELKKEILKSYYDSILLRDIVARYKLKNYTLLNELALFLLSNNATINAYNRLKNSFNTSFDTIRDYMEYLENAYLIFTINKFDFSYKKQLANPKKIYSIDTGLSNQVSFNISQKIGQNLENIVFLELIKKYKNIYYHKTTNALEIDFLIKQENCFELIQVSANLSDKKTLNRELRVFAQAKKELNSDIKAKIITLDENKTISYKGIEVEIVNIFEFLLGLERWAI